MANPKFLQTIFVITLFVAFVTISSVVVSEHADDPSKQHAGDDHEPETAADGQLSAGLRRFLASRRTCDKFPQICRAPGSPGPYCCKKKCVNIRTDRANCGACGRNCRFNQACCSGRCTRLSTDRNNCGSCGKRCGRFQRCFAGLCSYA